MGIKTSSGCFRSVGSSNSEYKPVQFGISSRRAKPISACTFFLGSEPKHKRWQAGALSDIARTLSAVEQLARFRRPISELNIAELTARNPPNLTAECSTVELPGDIGGTRKETNGDAGKPLTDARETSYVI
jgi:hypothetical protein